MMPAGDVAVRFEQVSKSIGEIDVLENISFDVPRGTVFSIITDFAVGVDGVTNVRVSRQCGRA